MTQQQRIDFLQPDMDSNTNDRVFVEKKAFSRRRFYVFVVDNDLYREIAIGEAMLPMSISKDNMLYDLT